MNNNMICNTETEVSKTLELNDRDYLMMYMTYLMK